MLHKVLQEKVKLFHTEKQIFLYNFPEWTNDEVQEGMMHIYIKMFLVMHIQKIIDNLIVKLKHVA